MTHTDDRSDGSTTVLVPGGRDVRGTLDDATRANDSGDGGAGSSAADRDGDAAGVVVACPPHPRHGGTRHDGRLRAVADRVGGRGFDCLRFDYGDWDEGYGEREDVRNAVRWATDRYERVGLFGYSFGATLALLAAATVECELGAVCVLAPTARLAPDLDAVAAVDDVAAPLRVVVGSRDDTVDWRPVADRAREWGASVVGLPGDHFFAGQTDAVAGAVTDFLTDCL